MFIINNRIGLAYTRKLDLQWKGTLGAQDVGHKVDETFL